MRKILWLALVIFLTPLICRAQYAPAQIWYNPVDGSFHGVANSVDTKLTAGTSAFVYTGVLAGIPATCAVGQVAFITDATAGQNLYYCTTTNVFTQQLNNGSSGATTALSNLATVSINTSLLAQTGVDAGSTTKPFRNLFLWGTGTYATTYEEITGAPTGHRVWTLQDASDTFVGLATTDTLTNKDVTSGTNTFPTFNQNTTGSAAKWTTARNLAGNSVDGSAAVNFTNHVVETGTADSGFTNATFLGALTTGLLKVTTTTGALSVGTVVDIDSLYTGSGKCYLFKGTSPGSNDGCDSPGGSGTVTTSGSPTSGTPTEFSGAAVIKNGVLADFEAFGLLNNCMTTAGDVIVGGASGVCSRVAVNAGTVPQILTSVGGATSLQYAGVPVDLTNPATLLSTDRASYLNWTSGTALAIPTVTASFASNLPFVIKNTSTTLTITPNAGESDLIDGSATGTVIPNFAAFVYSAGTVAPFNFYTIKFPTFAAFGSTCSNGLTWSTTTGIGCASSAPVTNVTGTSPVASSGGTTPAISINANGITATQLAAQYSKGSCTELWGGSGTSFALTSGDDAVSNNSCFNDSGVTRTITAVKCRGSVGSNTTTVNPTFGAAGTGTTILSGALTCGSSYAMSSSGTVSNASWTTGSGIDPAMSGTLTGTSIAMIVEYTY